MDGAVWVHISSSATAEKGGLGVQEPLLAGCQVMRAVTYMPVCIEGHY